MFTLLACSLWLLYVIFPSKPLFFNAAWYMLTFLSKTFLLHDTFVKRLDIAFGISAIMFGEWFDFFKCKRVHCLAFFKVCKFGRLGIIGHPENLLYFSLFHK